MQRGKNAQKPKNCATQYTAHNCHDENVISPSIIQSTAVDEKDRERGKEVRTLKGNV